MERDEKIQLLLDMQEHPEQFSEQALKTMLDDPEVHELLEATAQLKQAMINDESNANDVDAEWQRFEAHFIENKPERSWLKIAATFIGILMMSGIAFAVLHFMQGHSVESQASQTKETDTALVNQKVAAPVRFDDIRLDSILSVVSVHYGKAVSFRSIEAKGLKFIMAWNPDSSLTSIIDGLNMFDGLQLTLQQDTIFVETTEVKEDAE